MVYTEVQSPTEKELERLKELLEDPTPRNRAERRLQAKKDKHKKKHLSF